MTEVKRPIQKEIAKSESQDALRQLGSAQARIKEMRISERQKRILPHTKIALKKI